MKRVWNKETQDEKKITVMTGNNIFQLIPTILFNNNLYMEAQGTTWRGSSELNRRLKPASSYLCWLTEDGFGGLIIDYQSLRSLRVILHLYTRGEGSADYRRYTQLLQVRIYWMTFVTNSKISFVPFPTFLSSFATDCQTGEWRGSAATHRFITSRRVSSVPCCLSNFSHQAQMSPWSLSCPNARPNHSLAFSILRSDQKILATVETTNGLSFVFRRASAERVFLVGRGSDQTDNVHKRPDSGHSCRPGINYKLRHYS